MLELYPTMILHNPPLETVCRHCCRDDPSGTVTPSIMDSIDNGQTGDDSANTMSKESSIIGFIDCVGDKEEDAELNDDNGDNSKSCLKASH